MSQNVDSIRLANISYKGKLHARNLTGDYQNTLPVELWCLILRVT